MTYSYEVYEWDFVMQKGELKSTESDRGVAFLKAQEIAKAFCEDEKPLFMDMRNGIWIWDTGCDFGAKVVRKITGCTGCKHLNYDLQSEIPLSGSYYCDLDEPCDNYEKFEEA